MSRARTGSLAAAGLLAVLGLASPLTVTPLRAAEYTLVTVVRYGVDPANGRIAAQVESTFTNTTPNPPGQISAFPTVDLAIQPGASEVSASAADAELEVRLESGEGLLRASVVPPAPVRYGETFTFSLEYVLADGADTGLYVRPTLIDFVAWSFGTSSEVSVVIPDDGYQVEVDGDDLQAEASGPEVVLTSGPIADPSQWLARVVASRPAAYVTRSAAVPLAGGTVDLQVRAWTDDPAWGERILALLTDALPRLEEAIGVPYPGVGPLLVVESLPGTSDRVSDDDGGAELQVVFDVPDFTVLHQAAHVWIGPQFAGDRWIREGLASHVAAEVALDLDVALPYDPAERVAQLALEAFPLVGWGQSRVEERARAWAYAAAWNTLDRLATAIGESRLREALQRIADGRGPYALNASPAAGDQPPPPVDSEAFLDQLEAVSDADLSAPFAESVFEPATISALGLRSEARAAYAALLAAAGDWGAPDPVVLSLTDWRFEEALTRMDAAVAWLAEVDGLLREVEAAGLSTPARLRDAYRADGGGDPAVAELAATRAVVEAYRAARALGAHSDGPLERIGLLGTPDASLLLDEAASLFASGDLVGATEATAEATQRYQGAAVGGLLRLVAAAAVVLALIGLAIYLIRRPRRDDYTAAP